MATATREQQKAPAAGLPAGFDINSLENLQGLDLSKLGFGGQPPKR